VEVEKYGPVMSADTGADEDPSADGRLTWRRIENRRQPAKACAEDA